MFFKARRIVALITALCILTAFGANFRDTKSDSVYALYGTGANIVESLDRGITAINTGSGMLVSWRFLASDNDAVTFKLYRNNTLIYTSGEDMATCYLDKGGNASSSYRVDTVLNGRVISKSECTLKSLDSYFDLELDVPTSNNCTYSPNDCSVGDVDGDGVYELFVKWDPSNSKDNSQSGVTDNVYIDCYKLDGTKLWRIDLGINIRAGAHYTQFLVADFDCDGYAEMTCKTADGTVDGKGNVIGDATKDYRNSSGYILSGKEYYTLFDGRTGKALDTVEYKYPRGTVSKWGDSYGNRVDRFLGAVVYLDGVHPSAVTVRGYYTRMTACAYDVVNKKLVERWGFDTGNNSSAVGYGDGNHNCMAADVDNDGKQELILGAVCLDDDGSVLWCTNLGHGDALHIGDFLPDRNGLEVWVCHEEANYGASLLDGATGDIIFHYDGTRDTGRCCADNIWAGNYGAEFWSTATSDVYNGSGSSIATNRPAVNFLIYWDGDLERELLDDIKITKYKSVSSVSTLLTASGCASCNSTKATPCLSADLFGDWREELVLRTEDNTKLRIYCTTYTTDYRITTLMQDVQYRTQVAGQNVAYNQPAHVSYYLGSDYSLPDRPNVSYNNLSLISTSADYSLLETALSNAESYLHGDYTQKSLASLKAAVLAAEYVLESGTKTQSIIDNITESINNAVLALKPSVQIYADLNLAISAAESYSEAKYTKESYARLKTAVSAGRMVIDLNIKTPGIIDNITLQINNAVSSLKSNLQASYEALQSSIDEAYTYINSPDYTPSSLSALKAAVSAGEMLIENNTKSISIINDIKNQIDNEISKL